MSNCELAKNLIDKASEAEILFVIHYLQDAAMPDETPNADTIAAIEELESGGGVLFSGSTEALFAELMED